jgi:hypothetical protein
MFIGGCLAYVLLFSGVLFHLIKTAPMGTRMKAGFIYRNPEMF